MKQPFNWRGKTFFHSKSPTISCWKAQFWRDEFEGFDYPHKRCHMKIRNFFCLCCFFELMILNAKSLFSLKAKFGKDKNQTKRIERFFESIHKDLMFFPKKVKEVSDWKYLRDSKNDSFIFFLSQLNLSKTSIHFLVRISFTGQINYFVRRPHWTKLD